VTEPENTKPISFRLTEAQHGALATRAKAEGLSPGQLVRTIVLQELDAPSATVPKLSPTLPVPAGDDRLRRAVWVILVALSPDLDEEAAEAILQNHFDPDLKGGQP
jgi:hypothetical protein